MPLSWNEIKTRAIAFSKEWEHESSEDAEAKSFWDAFFEVFGVHRRRIASFEVPIKRHDGSGGFVDLLWKGILLVEHKSRGKDLDRAFGQARDYFAGLKDRDLPRYVLVSDFQRFRLHDLESGEQHEFTLKELHRNVRLFGFVAGYQSRAFKDQDPVNIKAAERMGKLHDALKDSGYTGHRLEVLLVRLLFCLFAEDTGIFEPRRRFQDYIEQRTNEDGSDLGGHLASLFDVLNAAPDERQNTLDAHLAGFPYVNGKLFAESLPSAAFNPVMRERLLDACGLDWSEISPAIFGALFQSIMDAKARRNLGAHYTSEKNILKLIGPLFLDGLRAEFAKVKSSRAKLYEFHEKLAHLKFLDPACGCGNFLVIAYRELRLLELDVIDVLYQKDQEAGQVTDPRLLIKCNVDQFYGIEIEEFPAQIAQLALWLVDHQVNLRVTDKFGNPFERLPLKKSATIRHGNALRIDWNEVVPAAELDYILGNPPFIGAKLMTAGQRDDLLAVAGKLKGAGLLDFVCAWYLKAAHYIQPVRPERSAEGAESKDRPCSNIQPVRPERSAEGAESKDALGSNSIRCAFVSTNSISQGEQVGVLWGELLKRGLHIQFAHRTFRWDNEARGVAAVHCVIVGFGRGAITPRRLFDYESPGAEPHEIAASNINPYLVDAPDVLLPNRSKPLCDVPAIGIGNKPIDGGNYLFTDDEKAAFIQTEPQAEAFFKRWLGSEEFINGWQRWCLWLGDCPPAQLRQMPESMKRVDAVRTFRTASKSPPTQKLADTPTRFHVENIPADRYLIIPKVSSERRRYIPIGFESSETFSSDLVFVVQNASLFHFGLLTSTMHMAWMRQVCGRLESRYRYSAGIVYNNFPWPEISVRAERSRPQDGEVEVPAGHPSTSAAGAAYAQDERGAKKHGAIEQAARGVLDARTAFPGSTLADLYDPTTMPPALVKAHQTLDRAVDAAYGKRVFKTDAERVAFLFERYQHLTSLLPVAKAKKARSRKEPA